VVLPLRPSSTLFPYTTLFRSPAFILTQFGFTAENVDQMITAPDDTTLVLKTDKAYAPTFVLYCLTAGVGSVVDSKLLQKHEVDRSEEHTSELQSRENLVCRLL